MKTVLMSAFVCALLGAVSSYAGEDKKPDLTTDKDKASFAVGEDFGNMIKDVAADVDLEAIRTAFKDAVAGKESKLTEAEINQAQETFTKFLRAKKAPAQPGAKPPALEDKDKVFYSIGRSIGENLKPYADSLNIDLVGTAFLSTAKGEATGFDRNQHMAAVQGYFQKMMADYAAKIKKDGEDFLAENKKKEGVTTTPTGLQYKILKKGDGPIPSGNDEASVSYEGKFINGKVFDSTAKNGGTPIKTRVSGGVIQGWLEALKLMPVGSKWELYIPGDLAYGPQGRPQIPPNAVLIFTVELLGMTKDPAKAEPKPETK